MQKNRDEVSTINAQCSANTLFSTIVEQKLDGGFRLYIFLVKIQQKSIQEREIKIKGINSG